MGYKIGAKQWNFPFSRTSGQTKISPHCSSKTNQVDGPS